MEELARQAGMEIPEGAELEPRGADLRPLYDLLEEAAKVKADVRKELAEVADLPSNLQALFSDRDPGPLHAAVSVGRTTLPSAAVWIDPLGGRESLLREILGSAGAKRAHRAADEAAHTTD